MILNMRSIYTKYLNKANKADKKRDMNMYLHVETGAKALY